MARQYRTFAEIRAEQEAKQLVKQDKKAAAKADKVAAKRSERQQKATDMATLRGIEHSFRDVVTAGFKFSASMLGMTIDRDKATFRTRSSAETTIAGSVAELVEGDASQRFTITRFALAGPFALAMPKKTGHRNILITAPDGQQVVVPVPASRTQDAVRFTARFNSLSATLTQ